MLGRIRLKLTLGYVGILALILVVFGLVVIVGFRGATVGQHDDVLLERARKLADGVSRAETVGDAMGNMSGPEASADYAVVHLAADGRVLFRDAAARELDLPSPGSSRAARNAVGTAEPGAATVYGSGSVARVASVPVIRSGEVDGVVQVGQSLETELEVVDRLVLVLVPIGGGALLVAGVGGLWMSGRALRPVRDAFERQRAFVADASHELKTPLSLARIDGEVVLRDPTAPDAGEILEHQLREIDRMGVLVSDLLLLARLDAGKLAVANKPFDLAPVLAETADRFRARASGLGVDLRVRAPAELPARGDAERASQVLAALLDNALRFTPEGGRVTVAGKRLDGRVEATVTDTGPGIAPQNLSRVFDRFYRADAGSSVHARDGRGAGLGLTIARDLSRAQGGELDAHGGGGGATLKLTLPAGSRV